MLNARASESLRNGILQICAAGRHRGLGVDSVGRAYGAVGQFQPELSARDGPDRRGTVTSGATLNFGNPVTFTLASGASFSVPYTANGISYIADSFSQNVGSDYPFIFDRNAADQGKSINQPVWHRTTSAVLESMLLPRLLPSPRLCPAPSTRISTHLAYPLT